MYNSLYLKQSITLSPNLIIYNKMLQMNAQDLSEHIAEMSYENPLIDLHETASKDIKIFKLNGKNPPVCVDGKQFTNDYVDDASVKMSGDYDSIYEHLSSQISAMNVSKKLLSIMKYLTYCLDSNGFLYADLQEISEAEGFALRDIAQALELLQSLEPAGVFARNLSECLLLQLERIGGDELCKTIVREHLEDMGRSHYNAIAKSLKCSDQEVRVACAQIKKLNPRPAGNFGSGHHTQYIVPDLQLVTEYKSFEVQAISDNLPKICLNEEYVKILSSSDDDEAREYLKSYLGKARELMEYVQRREKSLVSIAQFIADAQREYLLGLEKTLKPLKLADVAEHLELSESAISRAVRDKYMLVGSTVYELSALFCLTASKNTELSTDEVAVKIRELISSENPQKPLSDQKIADKLENLGIKVARRTVAKYRDSLGIASATGRKKA